MHRHKAVLSLRDAMPLRDWLARSPTAGTQPERDTSYVLLSGPEGGLSPAEEQAARDAGWAAITLGARVLRADTAPLAALSVIGALFESAPGMGLER
jgi:16S rRNA (uracil1498-N3)-methyltransferase